MVVRGMQYLKRNKSIILQFVKRETLSRYKGSQLGFTWTIITPLLMLLVYTFVFGEIFQAKWKTDSSSTIEFAIIIFCGLSTYNLFAEVISRSPHLITSNPNYVKKVVFPVETFSIIAVGSALINASINFLLVIIFQQIFGSGLSWSILMLPFVLLPLILYTLGLSWFLSSIGVFLRDIGQIIGVAVQALMLLSPIFYSIDVIPNEFKWFYQLNPITYFVENIRNVVIWGELPSINSYLIQLISSIIISILGLIWFRKTKQGFSDVL
ncbi:ABC transporter permease [Paenibacillus sp. 2TAB23]|uniref:ABC transporter permease n=1 Tax=Paenibacillus sp. 2TAB23 TaxID=3233004 RepID=UPI003F9476D0